MTGYLAYILPVVVADSPWIIPSQGLPGYGHRWDLPCSRSSVGGHPGNRPRLKGRSGWSGFGQRAVVTILLGSPGFASASR